MHAVATSFGTIHVAWTDTNGGTTRTAISNGNVSAPQDLLPGTNSYNWNNLAPGT